MKNKEKMMIVAISLILLSVLIALTVLAGSLVKRNIESKKTAKIKDSYERRKYSRNDDDDDEYYRRTEYDTDSERYEHRESEEMKKYRLEKERIEQARKENIKKYENQMKENYDMDSNSNSNFEIGDYVVYDVKYRDTERNTEFTQYNGWRILNPGVKNGDGTYSGVEIIPTGMPISLEFDKDEILKADGVNNYAWKGNTEDIADFKEKHPYIPKEAYGSGITAAAGLANKDKFNNMIIYAHSRYVDSDNGRAWRNLLEKSGSGILGNVPLKDVLIVEGVGKELRCPDLETIKTTMNKRKNPDGRKFVLGTDDDILCDSGRRDLFKPEDDAAKGFWCLQDLDIGEYTKKNGGKYWIASASSNPSDYGNLGYIYDDVDNSERYGRFSYGIRGDLGLRPIVSLKDNVKLLRSKFQGN